jgi:hypothetical protein
MLTSLRALSKSSQSSPEMPRIPALEQLYQHGVKFRKGQLIMIAGRPGSQKTGFAMWLLANWNLPTLYFAADTDSFECSTRLAAMRTGMTTEQIEMGMRDSEQRKLIEDAVAGVNITWSHDNPLTMDGLQQELTAYVELHGEWPTVCCLDNLMDCEYAATDHAEQMNVMVYLKALVAETGMTMIVLHHALESGFGDVTLPPSRDQIANKVSQKPQLTLTVALNPFNQDYRVAAVKQRGGRSDPSATDYVTLKAYPETTRFGPGKLETASMF